VRFFPHVHLPPWIRGRVLPMLEEHPEERAGRSEGLAEVIAKGLREEQRKQADEGKPESRNRA
jgi:hypothetical protein